MINLFQKLYPSVKWIYIDRKTEEVVESLLRSDGGMEGWFHHPVDNLRRFFLEKDYVGSTKEAYLTHLVEQHRKKADQFRNENGCLISYPEFLDQLETKIIPHFNLQCSDQEMEKMKRLMAFYSK